MPKPEFFKSLGLFVESAFLDPQTCERLRAEIRSCDDRRPGSVWKGAGDFVVDEDTRRTESAMIAKDLRSAIKSRLLELKPRIEAHFGVPLDGCEPPQFLWYRPGGFYRPHLDCDEDGDTPECLQQRSVSIVAFLNGHSGECASDSYAGGALTFYGLMKEEAWARCGFGLDPEAGLLVAFRSNLVHEVKPVTAGDRFTVVSWYFSAK